VWGVDNGEYKETKPESAKSFQAPSYTTVNVETIKQQSGTVRVVV